MTRWYPVIIHEINEAVAIWKIGMCLVYGCTVEILMDAKLIFCCLTFVVFVKKFSMKN